LLHLESTRSEIFLCSILLIIARGPQSLMKAHLRYHVMDTCFNNMSLKNDREIIEWNVMLY